MSETDTNQGTSRRLLTAAIVLFCLILLFQLGLLLQRHLAHSATPTPAAASLEIAWNPDDEISAMHTRINQLFDQAFDSSFSPHPPAAASSPGLNGGSADSSFDNPFVHMHRMQRQIDALFSGAMVNRTYRPSRFDEGWAHLEITPGFSVRDTGDVYEITVQLPGVNKSNIHIQMDHSVLGLSVEQDLREATVAPDGGTVRQSRQTNRFERHLRLPDATDRQDAIKATLNHGVLHIVVPKAPQTNAPAHSVPIQ